MATGKNVEDGKKEFTKNLKGALYFVGLGIAIVGYGEAKFTTKSEVVSLKEITQQKFKSLDTSSQNTKEQLNDIKQMLQRMDQRIYDIYKKGK